MTQTDTRQMQQPVSPDAGALAEDAALSKPPSGKTFFAVVNANGALARGSDAKSSQNLGTGFYEVLFKFDVTACAYIACIGNGGSGAVEPSGEITVVGRNGQANGVFITTADSGGPYANRGFHLLVRS